MGFFVQQECSARSTKGEKLNGGAQQRVNRNGCGWYEEKKVSTIPIPTS